MWDVGWMFSWLEVELGSVFEQSVLTSLLSGRLLRGANQWVVGFDDFH